ncbi:hypothetical protein ES702_06287 [subsurface metagenome]
MIEEIKHNNFQEVEKALLDLFETLSLIQAKIRQRLEKLADGKNLKGNELVGWLGEIYGKILFDGYLVDDSHEHDVETEGGLRISVKTRKGFGGGWKQTSPIPQITGPDSPTHLLFVHLDDLYKVDRIWFYPWRDLLDKRRFKTHRVRGFFRSYLFFVQEESDKEYLIYEHPWKD